MTGIPYIVNLWYAIHIYRRKEMGIWIYLIICVNKIWNQNLH